MNDRYEKVRFWVLRRLIRSGYGGRRPINFDDLKIPKISNAELREACKDMLKEGLLFSKHGKYGIRYGLDPRNRKRIEEEYERLKNKVGFKRLFVL